MNIDIDIASGNWGDVEHTVRRAAEMALDRLIDCEPMVEVSIKLSDNCEVKRLNRDFRGKDNPTNILSFGAEPPNLPWQAELPRPLGDIILAYSVVRQEAEAQGKTLENHLSHLIVHGVLHLWGYDHRSKDAAKKMEALEIEILAGMGISNPYLA